MNRDPRSSLTLIGPICFGIALSSAWAACPGPSNGPDLIVGTLAQLQGSQQIVSFGSDSLNGHTYVAFSVGTTSCNIGNTTVNWYPDPDDRHPVISQNCFRLKPDAAGYTRFEQIGQTWAKHGFAALAQSVCCACTNPGTFEKLGVGCSDPYAAGRNGTQGDVSPRWQINPVTGEHAEPTANPPFTGANTGRRLRIDVLDLEPSTTRNAPTKYFVEGQYNTEDDAAAGNQNNNASYRQISVNGSGSNWTFGVFGTDPNVETIRQRPGIRAWKDLDPTVTETDVVTPEDGGFTGLVIVSAQATNLGGGLYHYEYAVQNLSSDRAVASISIPVSIYATLSHLGFHDVNYYDGDGINDVTTDGADWAPVVAGGAVTWSVAQSYADNPNGNALRWGTLSNFRFDADVAPSPGILKLAQFKLNAVDMTATTIAPAAIACTRGDLNGDGLVNGADIARFVDRLVIGGGTPTERCAGDLETTPDGQIGVADVNPFAMCLVSGGGC